MKASGILFLLRTGKAFGPGVTLVLRILRQPHPADTPGSLMEIRSLQGLRRLSLDLSWVQGRLASHWHLWRQNMLAVCLEAAIPVGKEGMASGRPVTSELGEEQASRAVNPSASRDYRILMKWNQQPPQISGAAISSTEKALKGAEGG